MLVANACSPSLVSKHLLLQRRRKSRSPSPSTSATFRNARDRRNQMAIECLRTVVLEPLDPAVAGRIGEDVEVAVGVEVKAAEGTRWRSRRRRLKSPRTSPVAVLTNSYHARELSPAVAQGSRRRHPRRYQRRRLHFRPSSAGGGLRAVEAIESS